jgi:hypothetical protein
VTTLATLQARLAALTLAGLAMTPAYASGAGMGGGLLAAQAAAAARATSAQRRAGCSAVLAEAPARGTRHE